jgi:hypothetical protein
MRGARDTVPDLRRHGAEKIFDFAAQLGGGLFDFF